jgi:hypothetical protein
MSDWCRQVYPGISDLKVQSIVDGRASSCDFFDEFDEFDGETTFTA